MNEYKDCEKKVRNMIRNAKKNLEKRLARSDGSGKTKRHFYAYVRKKTKTKATIGPLIGEGGMKTEDGEIAEELNRFFSSVFTREDLSSVPEPEPKYGARRLDNVNITVAKVKRQIRRLRKDAAPGPDGIGPKVLQELIDQVAEPLCTVMKKSLDQGQIGRAHV